MGSRTRLVLGSLVGGIAVQVALVACGVAAHDGGVDVHALDVAAHDGDVFDAIEDTAHDALDAINDATIPDAHADGGTCTCTPPAPAVTTFRGDATTPAGTGIRTQGSVASVYTQETIGIGGVVELSWIVTASGFAGPDRYFSYTCRFRTNLSGQGVHTIGTENCNLLAWGGPDQTGALAARVDVTDPPIVSGFSDTGATIALPDALASGYALRGIVVTHVAPVGQFPYLRRDYRP